METRSAKTVATSAVGRFAKGLVRSSQEADIEVVNLASSSDSQRTRGSDSGSLQNLNRLHSSIVKSSPVLPTTSRTNPSKSRQQQWLHSVPSNVETPTSLVDKISSDYEESWLDDLPSPSLLLKRCQAEQDILHYDLAESFGFRDEALDPAFDVLSEQSERPVTGQEHKWMNVSESPAANLEKAWKSSERHTTAKKVKAQSPSAIPSPRSTSSKCLSNDKSREGHKDQETVIVENQQNFDGAVLKRGLAPASNADTEHLCPPVREALGTLSRNGERESRFDSPPTKRQKMDHSGLHEEDDLVAISASKSERQLPHRLQLPWDDLTGLDFDFLAEIADIVEFV